MTLSAAAHAVDGIHTGKDPVFCSVSTDTRTIEPGALFVALRGERFNGHDHIEDALSAGAVGAMSEQAPLEGVPTIGVGDSLVGLQRLAANWRRRFTTPVVAVTGSNGKTTVKEMIGKIFSATATTLVSSGNFNNHIGMPLSLLRLRDEHRYVVLEMGMNHPGELDLLSKIARPDVALINNAAAAHLEGMGSVARVAEAKAEIFNGLGVDGVAIINGDDEYAGYWRSIVPVQRCVSFGFERHCDVRAIADFSVDNTRLRIEFEAAQFDLLLKVPGTHNARNAVAAAAVAISLGIDAEKIVEGLESFTAVDGRGQIFTLVSGALLINDSYNANPASLNAALEVLARYPGERILVLGDMAELGPQAGKLHREVAYKAKGFGIQHLYGLGPMSRCACETFGPGAWAFNDVDALLNALRTKIHSDMVILVKGSRSMKMERIVNALLADSRIAGEVC